VIGDEKGTLLLAMSTSVERGVSSSTRGAGDESKTSKSAPRMDGPCKLLRFATGLPMLAVSIFMTPSLRLRGLDLIGIKQLVPGGFKSGFDRANSNLMGSSLMSNRKAAGISSASYLSTTNSGLALRIAVFSSPETGRAMKGETFPWLVESTSARRGLLGRVRGDDRKGAVRRRLNFFLLVVAAAAKGETG
jgi:hypothetical protein